MKIVLDTNVLVSGIFFSGPPYQILKAWQERIIKRILYYKAHELLAGLPPIYLSALSKEFTGSWFTPARRKAGGFSVTHI